MKLAPTVTRCQYTLMVNRLEIAGLSVTAESSYDSLIKAAIAEALAEAAKAKAAAANPAVGFAMLPIKGAIKVDVDVKLVLSSSSSEEACAPTEIDSVTDESVCRHSKDIIQNERENCEATRAFLERHEKVVRDDSAARKRARESGVLVQRRFNDGRPLGADGFINC